MPLSIHSFPRAILHVDGDAFFASCEMAMNPTLRGKPVITGKERGIVASLSYEAKARGVKRGMMLSDVRKICPEAVVLPSDYETYSLFSKRMFAIVRRYTPDVEEYSIDECFANLTGLRRPNNMSYERMAERIKEELDGELGMTFSIGLGPNKSIAKIGSKWKKPSGLTIIPAYAVHNYLKDLPVGKIWGIGPQTTAFLSKLGVYTSLDYAYKSEEWIRARMSKPYREIWEELRGGFVFPIVTEAKHAYQSISKTKTFTPPSSDRATVHSQLCRNIENACIKARRHSLVAKKIFFYLKTQEFTHRGLEITMTNPTAIPNEITRIVSQFFDEVFVEKTLYRATGIVLMDLTTDVGVQPDLFGSSTQLEKWRRVYATVDAIDNKFGKHTVFLATSSHALNNTAHLNERGDIPTRTTNRFKGENVRQKVGIPMLGKVT